jgi:Tfp pilus assembly protein PilF
MSKRLLVVAALAVAAAPLLAGCQNPDNNKWLGAGIGVAAGGLGGRAIAGKKHKTAGTLIGAVVGGVAGFAIAGGFGSNASEEQRSSSSFQQANSEFEAGRQAKTSGNNTAALQHYEAAGRLAPDQPESYNNAGLIYLEQGDRANAEQNFRRALTVDPDFQPARTNLQQMGLAP